MAKHAIQLALRTGESRMCMSIAFPITLPLVPAAAAARTSASCRGVRHPTLLTPM